MGYKWYLEQKRLRDIKLYAYHLNNPDISFRDLGKIFKLTGARVGQIIKKMEVANVHNNDAKEA